MRLFISRFLTASAVAVFALTLLLLAPMALWPPSLGPLPKPELACSAPPNWHGLTPGRSSLVDVVRTLGRPVEVNYRQYPSGWMAYLAYPVEGGLVARFAEDRVFVRRDGVVAWIEVTRADRDGKFHPAAEVINQLGKTLDIVYRNNSYDPGVRLPYDVWGYQDELYVWSECGIALDVHGACSAAASGALACMPGSSLGPHSEPLESDLTVRHPNPYPDPSLRIVQATSENAMLMEFLFPPTSYRGFTDYYMHKIPFGQWDDYLRQVQAK